MYQPENDGFEDLIAGLPEGPRTVLTMRFVEDMSYGDMAKQLDCSELAARRPRVERSAETER